MRRWVGFDLDNTLAVRVEPFHPLEIGQPNPFAVELVRRLIKADVQVKIFTCRVAIVEGLESEHGRCDEAFAKVQRELIAEWTDRWIGYPLEATATKDFACCCIVDDIALEWGPGGLRMEQVERGLHSIAMQFGRDERKSAIDAFYRPSPPGRRR